MTEFRTAVGGGRYALTFETDDAEHYKIVQEAARRCVDCKSAEWLPPVVGAYGVVCSVCKTQSDDTYDFCPNCGAKMEE